MYSTYMSDDRRSDAPKQAGPEGLPPDFPPFGVAVRLLGITKRRDPRLAWRKIRGQRNDQLSVNRP